MRSPVLLALSTAVLLAACASPGGEPGMPPDALSPVDGPQADAPDSSPTPLCIGLLDEPDSCRECLAGPPLAIDGSVCAQTVCTRDPSCCTTQWDSRCVQLADTHCGIDECLNTVALTGNANLIVAQWDGAAVQSDSWISFADEMIPGADWADYDGDGLADAVFVSDCHVKVLRGRGWSGDQLSVVTELDADLGCGTMTPSYGASARWADVDEDGDLDVIAVGNRGGFWVKQEAGGFPPDDAPPAGYLVPPGTARMNDLSVGDLDGDRHLDVIAVVGRARPGTDDYYDTIERFEYSPIEGFVGDAGWGDDYNGAHSIRSCDIAGDATREMVFSGSNVSSAHPIVEGKLGNDTLFNLPGGSGPVTCGNLDGDPLDEVIIAHRLDDDPMDLAIIDGGVVVWRSSTNQPVPFTVEAGALEAIDLDDDGDLDLVVGGATINGVEGVVTVLRRQPGAALSFTVEPVGDLLVGHDTLAAQVLHLPRRPPAR